MSTARSFLLIALAALAGLSTVGRADDVGQLFNGARIEGLVHPDEDIRLTLPLAAGTVGKLKFSVLGSSVPVSFSSPNIVLLDPNMEPVLPGDDPDVDDLIFGAQKIKKNKSTFKIDRLFARVTGDYTLVLRTNARITLNAVGKWKVKRAKKVPFQGDESSGDFPVSLGQFDEVLIRVKTGDGAAPRIEEFIAPGINPFPPFQAFNSKGAKTVWLRADQTADHAFKIGYQQGGTTGSFAGFMKFRPARGAGTVRLKRANPPGVILGVLDADRVLDIGFGDTGIGIAAPDPRTITLTSERGGQLVAVKVTDGLSPIIGQTAPTVLLTSAPPALPAGEQLQGHRLIWSKFGHVVSYSTASGQTFGLIAFNAQLQQTGNREVLALSPTSTLEAFLTRGKDGDDMFAGLLAAPFGHTVRGFDLAFDDTVETVIPASLGAHVNGAVAAWHPGLEQYEVWAPDSLVPGAPSDLNRQFYSDTWIPVSAARPLVTPNEQETMSTALSIDFITNASIVHYVVVRNPNVGTGEIHRRIFDMAGDEVPGGHAVIMDVSGLQPAVGLNRPTTIILGAYLYLGYETPNGPRVLRYPLLR